MMIMRLSFGTLKRAVHKREYRLLYPGVVHLLTLKQTIANLQPLHHLLPILPNSSVVPLGLHIPVRTSSPNSHDGGYRGRLQGQDRHP